MAVTTPKAEHGAPDQILRAATVPFSVSDDAHGAGRREKGDVAPAGPAETSRARSKPPVPPSGAWREGDDPGRRQFADVGTYALEAGGRLPAVRVAYETWGTLNTDGSNAVLVLHALTGDSHVTGEAGPGHVTSGWWAQMVGPGRPIDTDRYFVVAPNALGGCQGTTGPTICAHHPLVTCPGPASPVTCESPVRACSTSTAFEPSAFSVPHVS